MNNKKFNKIGNEYKGFHLIKIDNLKDLNAKGYHFRHKDLGMDFYHVSNDNKENTFAIGFRTFAKNNKGAAHIVEHSVLCGSEKYDLKDPFVVLNQQNLSTFLNAFTYLDKTIYPGSSMVKKELFNIFDVYMDATFFPLLKKETFLQEAWRLEYKDDNPTIQGVVYNEMKGSYSNFDNIKINFLYNNFFSNDSFLSFESGGYPSDIPTLTYDEFKDFHKKFYSPSNCIIVTAGNIPTSDYIDFIADKYVDRLISKYGKLKDVSLVDEAFIRPDIKEISKIEIRNDTAKISGEGTSDGTPSNDIAWSVKENSIDMSLLGGLLTSGKSKFTLMLEKKFNSQLSNISGYAQDKRFGMFIIGIKNQTNIYDSIIELLNEYKKSITQDDIDAVVKSMEKCVREQSYPVDLLPIINIIDSWTSELNIENELLPISDVEELKKRANVEYVCKLIDDYLINNKPKLDFQFNPSENYTKTLLNEEEKIINKLVSSSNKEDTINAVKELNKYQESEDKKDIIPHCSANDVLEDEIDLSNYDFEEIDDICIAKQPYSASNGLIYFEILRPVDNFSAEDFIELPFFLYKGFDFGYENKSYTECMNEINKYISYNSSIFYEHKYSYNSDKKDSARSKALMTLPNKNIKNRIWFRTLFRFLESDIDEALNIISKIESSSTYNDEKKIEIESIKFFNNIKESLSYMGLSNSKLRKDSFESVMEDILNGESLYNRLVNDNKTNQNKLEVFKRLFNLLKNEGAFITVTGTNESINKVIEKMPAFIKNADIKNLSEQSSFDITKFDKYKSVIKNYKENKPIVVKFDVEAGDAHCCFSCSEADTKEFIAENVLLSGFAEMHQMWTKIRTQGGSYGSSAYLNKLINTAYMGSYRDPTPEKTLGLFKEILEELVEYNFTKDETEKAVLSILSRFLVSPNLRSKAYGLSPDILSGKTNETTISNVRILKNITPEDLHNAAVRLLNSYNKKHDESMTVKKSFEATDNVIDIFKKAEQEIC